VYEIEKGIPIPKDPQRGKRGPSAPADQKHQLDQMAIGDSFTTPGRKANSTCCRELNRAKSYGRKTGKKFRGRFIGDNTVLVWRIE